MIKYLQYHLILDVFNLQLFMNSQLNCCFLKLGKWFDLTYMVFDIYFVTSKQLSKSTKKASWNRLQGLLDRVLLRYVNAHDFYSIKIIALFKGIMWITTFS